MEQNIHMHHQDIKNRQIPDDFHNENPVISGEIKNEPSTVHKTSLNVGKRTLSCDILSPEIIESYSLHPAILVHSNVQESHRAKMHMWIMQNCHIRGLSFKTASLACYILDLYFSKGHNCPLQDLHEFGICCLRIANKLEDNIFLPINYDVFNREKLIGIQAQICLNIDFQLNPLTYTDISSCLSHLWNQFRDELKNNGLSHQNTDLNEFSLEDKAKIVEFEMSFILLHETLELLYLILDTLAYSVDHLVFNTFYMTLWIQFHSHQKLLTSSKIQSLTRKSVKFNKIMAYFIKFCKDSSYQLKLEIDENCLMFVYPVYNALISENVEAKSPKDREVLFDPNDESLRLSENMMCQTMRFKNKKGSLKKYLKRQTHQNLRKCSEMTCP